MNDRMSPPRVAGRYWPLLVVGLLGLNAGIVALTIFVATRDPSVATEPDYYAKALKYDDVIRQRELNAKLGWSAACSLRNAEGAELVVSLHDRQGAAISGAHVSAIMFAGLRSGERQHVVLSANPAMPGEYVAPVQIDRQGLWNVRVTAEHDGTTFTHEAEMLIPQPRGGS